MINRKNRIDRLENAVLLLEEGQKKILDRLDPLLDKYDAMLDKYDAVLTKVETILTKQDEQMEIYTRLIDLTYKALEEVDALKTQIAASKRDSLNGPSKN